jgi:hypothetical protein
MLQQGMFAPRPAHFFFAGLLLACLLAGTALCGQETPETTGTPERAGLAFHLDAPGGLVLDARLHGDLRAQPGGNLAIAAHLDQGRLTGPWIAANATGRADVDLAPSGRLDGALSLDLDHPAVRLGSRSIQLQRLLFSFRNGTIHPDGRLHLAGLRLAAPGLLQCRGQATSDPESAALDLRCRLEHPDRLQALLALLLGAEFPNLDLPHAFPLRLQARMDRGGETRSCRIRIHSPDPIRLEPPSVGAVRVPQFTATLEGRPPEATGAGLQCDGRVQFHGRAEVARHAMADPRLKFSLESSQGRTRFTRLQLRLPPGGLAYANRSLDSGPVRLHGDLDFKPDGAARGDFLLNAKQAGAWRIQLHAPPEGRLSLQAAAQDLGAAEAARLLDIYTDTDLEPFQPTGRVQARALYTAGPRGQRLEARLKLRKLAFSSPDGRIMADRLNATLQAQASLPEQGRGRLRAELAVPSGDLLYGPVYVPFDRHPLQVAARTVGLSAWPGQALACNASMQGLASLRLKRASTPSRGPGAWNGTVRVDQVRLKPAYDIFIKAPLSMSQPFLADSHLNGTAQARVRLQGAAGFADATGLLGLSGTGFRLADANLTVQGLELRLPLAYRLGADPGATDTPPAPADPGWGRLRWESLQAFGLQKLSTAIPLELRPNELVAGRNLRIPALGGGVTLSSLRIRNPLSRDFRLETSVWLHDLDLAALPAGDIPVQGRLEGRLSRITATREFVRAEGRLTGALFGGDLEVAGLGVESPFATDRSFGLNLKVDRMHLGELSRALGVGRITGQLDLDVDNLQIAYGQPVAFNVTARSVEAPGVSQRISLAAVNSLSVLGTGSGLGDVGAGIMASVLDELPYASIGLACDLKNDVFTVQGLMEEGGVQYIVKRPLLFGVNVVNSNPDNRINFSDMLRRLERVVGRNREQPEGEGS